MTQVEAAALASWFRRAAKERANAREVEKWFGVKRYRALLRDAAAVAERLLPDDKRLVCLVEARRFSEFYGEVVFVGGGAAIYNAKLGAVGL
jgi:hypothetical protein